MGKADVIPIYTFVYKTKPVSLNHTSEQVSPLSNEPFNFATILLSKSLH